MSAAAQAREWQEGASPSTAAPATMLDLLHAAVAAAPAAPAMLYFDGRLDFATLDDLSDRLAAHWRAAGVGPGDRVAIILQNTPPFAIAVAAAWKLGAVPTPMNPMYRPAELARLFADSEPRAILCHDDNDDAVAAAAGKAAAILTTPARDLQTRDDARVLPGRVCRGDDLMAVLCAAPPLARVHRSEPQELALLLYTSGTTGVPKGAMLTHANLVANALLCRDWFALGPQSRIFGMAPLFHITGFVCHLCAGLAAVAPVVLTYRFSPAVALDAFREHRPTFTIGAITAYVALMQAPEARPEDFASFTQLYSGGAPIAPALVQRFAATFGKAIRSCYGMTETAAPTHLSPPDGPIPIDPASGALSIGIAAPGLEAALVGEDRAPLPVGEIGELALRGKQVMVGYWRKPAETAEVLVDGWMHTGDIGFCDAAGWFYLVDRKKDMIVASGFKVWPREVEDVLYAHPAVREAAVVGAPDAYRGETVRAYVSFNAGASGTEEALIAHCRERLAAYKAPREVVVLPDLPKTISGKIMRAELRRSAAERPCQTGSTR